MKKVLLSKAGSFTPWIHYRPKNPSRDNTVPTIKKKKINDNKILTVKACPLFCVKKKSVSHQLLTACASQTENSGLECFPERKTTLQRDTESCLRNDSHTEANWLQWRLGIQHTQAHSLTQGNDKYYIFIKGGFMQFVADVQNTEMLQSLKQRKGFFQGPIVPNCRTGHWAEQKPQTGLGVPIKQKHAAHTTEKGQGCGREKRHFQRKTQKELVEAFVFHNKKSPRVPAITTKTPCNISLASIIAPTK